MPLPRPRLLADAAHLIALGFAITPSKRPHPAPSSSVPRTMARRKSGSCPALV